MTTYYVDVTTGLDTDTGLSEALAWQTLGYAANQVAADDFVYVKNTASYVVADPDTATVVFEITTAGGSNTPIVWEGYETTPGDGGLTTVDANTNTLANACSTTLAATYNIFKNMRFTGGSDYGFSADSGAGDNMMFIACRFDNNDGGGIIMDNFGTFVNCLADNNGGKGFEVDNVGILIGCIAHTNSGRGIEVAGYGAAITFCQSYNNGANEAIAFGALGSAGCVINSIVDGDKNAGSTGMVLINSSTWCALVNNIIFDCNVGIDGTHANGPERKYARNNLFYADTSGSYRVDFQEGTDDVEGTEDPFTASATRDYSLKTDSEAEAAGYDAADAVDFWDR